jgi:hypothetical protein
VLAKYNLIERVAMPDFVSVPDEPESEARSQKPGDRSQKTEVRRQKTEDRSQKPKSKSQKTDADGTGDSAVKSAVPVSPLDIDKLWRGWSDFAEQVFVMVFDRPADTGRLVDRRELAALAGAWNRALLAKLKPLQLEELWEKSVKMKTADIRRLRKAKKPGAAWMTIFNGRLAGMTNKK